MNAVIDYSNNRISKTCTIIRNSLVNRMKNGVS